MNDKKLASFHKTESVKLYISFMIFLFVIFLLTQSVEDIFLLHFSYKSTPEE